MALFSRVKTWVTNEVLTASDLNAEFDNILTNATANKVVGYSANSSQMQTADDPYPGGSVSLASSVAEEITRLRYVVKQLSGQAQWYVDPPRSVATGALSVATADINDNAVTTVKIADSNVTEVKIANSNVTTPKIADSNVTTVKIADGNVTLPKLVASAYLHSSSCGTYTTSSAVATTITNLSGSFTVTANRPVLVYLTATNTAAYFETSGGTASTIFIQRDGSNIATLSVATGAKLIAVPPTMDDPGAGTYTYRVQCSTDGTFNMNNYRLLVMNAL